MTALSEYVPLKGGLIVPAAPLLLLFELEGRGFTLTQVGDKLTVQPAANLTPDDCARITRWKIHLLALLAYEPPSDTATGKAVR